MIRKYDQMTDSHKEFKISHYTLTQDRGKERVDKFLAKELKDLSRSDIQRLLDGSFIRIAEEVISKKTALFSGDVITVTQEFSQDSLIPQDIPLDVVYEDEHLIVINKAAGMVVHPGSNTGDDTLVHALIAHCGDGIRGVGDPDRPGVVHRLDKETSGLIVLAKDSETHSALQKLFSGREVYKKYDCLVTGNFEKKTGIVEQSIGRHPTVRIRMAVTDEGRYAKTEWFLKENYEQYAHVQCRIYTGRTHQIRVHMKHIGHPLLGDTTYGFKAKQLSGKLEIPRVMLNSSILSFIHPKSKKQMEFEIELPEDFRKFL